MNTPLNQRTPAISGMKIRPQDASALAKVFLESGCAKIPGVGPKILEKLGTLQIHTLGDLLWHLPRDFEDRRSLQDANQARNYVNKKAQFDLQIQGINVVNGRTARLVINCVDLQNPGEEIQLVFFKPQPRQQSQWQQHNRVRVFGEVTLFSSTYDAIPQITHPDFVFLDDNPPALSQSLTPIYPSVQGLHQKTWRKWFNWLFEQLQAAPFSIDMFAPVIQQLTLQSAATALTLLEAFRAVHNGVHMVITDAQLTIDRNHPAVERLALEEIIHQQLLWAPSQNKEMSTAFAVNKTTQELLLQGLPFQLTGAQIRCVREIEQDLNQTKPMMRLLQGDVGSGKTLVAALAAAQVAEHHQQVAILAPTEILAKQHFSAFKAFFAPLQISIEFLTGKLKPRERQAQLKKLQSGETQVVIGTHALFQKDVIYHRLGLVIVDEQHRFGVEQRLALVKKGLYPNLVSKGFITPHQLMMSATPIPRTLTMSIYAHLSTSIIDELPPSRKEVITRAIGECRRDEVYTRVLKYLSSGQQAFWVCSLIHETETSGGKKSIEETFETLKAALPSVSIGVLHGQLNDDEKEETLNYFIQNKYALLLATSMVEVGVNIPNANLMVVENAQNWGLTQLHQLRGRVGRGDRQGYMLLIHKSPLPKIAHERLDILRKSNDGFEIAERDLQIRGPGQINGTAQSGHVHFKIADLELDSHLFELATKISHAILQNESRKA